MAAAPRPWWVGPLAGGAFLFAAVNAPGPTGDIVRHTASGAANFVAVFIPDADSDDRGAPPSPPSSGDPSVTPNDVMASMQACGHVLEIGCDR